MFCIVITACHFQFNNGSLYQAVEEEYELVKLPAGNVKFWHLTAGSKSWKVR
jgi:hypothetical protein